MSYIDECLQKFRELPKSVQDLVGGFEVVQKIKAIESKYKVDLSFFIVLVVVGELSMEDIEEYLEKKYGLNKETAKQLDLELQEQIFNPALDVLFPEDIEPTSLMNFDEEKRLIVDLFKTDLINIFLGDNKIKDAINKRIFYILNKELSYQKDIVFALNENSEKISTKRIEVSAKKVFPTISNWIKDCVQKKGAKHLNSIDISDYVANSVNSSSMSSSDKELLKDLIVLYNNIKFFPESMPNDTGKDWELIPLKKEKDKNFQSKIKKNVLISKKEVKIKPQTSTKQIMQEILIGSKEEEARIKKFEAEIKKLEGEKIDNLVLNMKKDIEQSGLDKQEFKEKIIARLRVIAKLNNLNKLSSLISLKTTKLTPEMFKEILNDILGTRLNLEKKDIVRYAMQIAMILKKAGNHEFMPLIYFDKKEQIFKWNE